ncbi:DNA-directed DNA polymerase [Spizellomyces sp. 'palustris']|nr:DNA-directed DNA polymerase [Spizellomyces sp. 'palustris']
MDVTTAFLNGEVDSELYVEQPLGISTEHSPDKFVCLLKKGLYGLKQAGRLWNHTLHSHLHENSFKQLAHEPCVYIWQGEESQEAKISEKDECTNINSRLIILAVYVDDLVIATKSKEDRNWVKTTLVIRDKPRGILSLDQAHYITEVLRRFKMENSNPVSTPLDTSVRFEALGLNQPMKTASYGLVYQQNGDDLEAYSDADWGGDLSDRKSTSGWLLKLSGGAIARKSSKQRCTALSTVEAEYIAASDCAREVIWMRNLLAELGFLEVKQHPTMLKMDNNGTMELAKNTLILQRTKHIDIRYHFLREHIKSGKISVKRCPTQQLTADVLTKAIPAPRFAQCCAELGVHALDDAPNKRA